MIVDEEDQVYNDNENGALTLSNNGEIHSTEEKEESRCERWEELPSVVLVQVYSYLSQGERLSSALVSKGWRGPAFQLPLSESLHLNMGRGEVDIPKVVFLSEKFICKVKHVTFTFDISSHRCFQTVEKVLTLLLGNGQLKSLKMKLSEHSILHLKDSFNCQLFVRKVLTPLLKVLQGRNRNQLETFSFPLIQNLTTYLGGTLLSTLSTFWSQSSLKEVFLQSVPMPDIQLVKRFEDCGNFQNGCPAEVLNLEKFSNLQILSINHDFLTDSFLRALGVGNVLGGLKRLNLVAVQQNANVSNAGWSAFVGHNPECTVRLTVSGGSDLVAHASNLVFPSMPLSHFRSYNSKDTRVNFLNSVVGWNLETLEHLELMDYTCNWLDVLSHLDPEENEFLDPIVYAAWRCKKLHTVKLGVRYCGDSLVGIARLKGPNLLHLEIPRSRIEFNSLNLRKLSKEVTAALGRPWKPLSSKTMLKSLRPNASIMKTYRAAIADEL